MSMLEEKTKIENKVEKTEVKLESKVETKTNNKENCNLINCEDCGCLIHINVYNSHKRDEICKNRGVCGTCWKGYYDEYVKNQNR